VQQRLQAGVLLLELVVSVVLPWVWCKRVAECTMCAKRARLLEWWAFTAPIFANDA
jgi:hypothetical protein